MPEPGGAAQSRGFVLHAEGPNGRVMVRDLVTLEVAELDSLDQLAETLAGWLARDPGSLGVGSMSDRLPELTETEVRVGALAAGGISNKAIAATLDIRLRTVESHLTSAYSKLGVKSRRELARLINERSP